MKRAIVLTHAPFEGPARIAPLLAARGYAIDRRALHAGDAVPARLDEGDVLIVMGGPMGVADRERLPFLQREIDLLARAIDDDAPVLGICLGAQLLAFAGGASVGPMIRDGARRYEVGWAPVRFHARSDGDAILRGVPHEAQVLHWHGDMFDLPRDARCLASTEVCPQQGFQLRSRLFGLQFHCEVGAADIEQFVQADAAFVAQAEGADGVAKIRRDTAQHLASFEAMGDRLLGNMLDAMVIR